MHQEILLYQILSGKVVCNVFGNTIHVNTPTPEHKMVAKQIYLDTMYESELDGVLTEDEMYKFIISYGFWSIEEESELETAATRIDGIKEEMYKNYAAYKSVQVEKLRTSLNKARIRAGMLFQKKHAYDIYTCTGLASIYQLQYLLSKNAFYEDGKPAIDIDNIFMQQLSEQYVLNRPNDNEIRQLSKFELWKSIWHSSKGSTSVFGVAASQLSDEQRNLISWSRLYDNINESMEPPTKEVLDDDDLLDGWLIIQHKKRENEKGGGDSSSYANRHGGAQEIFVPVETTEDARRVNSMNDIEGNITKKQRENLIKKYGRIEEQNLPDAQQKMLMQATQAFTEKMRHR